MHACRLRRGLELAGAKAPIVNTRGVGYVLAADSSRQRRLAAAVGSAHGAVKVTAAGPPHAATLTLRALAARLGRIALDAATAPAASEALHLRRRLRATALWPTDRVLLTLGLITTTRAKRPSPSPEPRSLTSLAKR